MLCQRENMSRDSVNESYLERPLSSRKNSTGTVETCPEAGRQTCQPWAPQSCLLRTRSASFPGRQRLRLRCCKTRPRHRASAPVKVAAVSGARRRCRLQRLRARGFGAFSFLSRSSLAKVPPPPHVPSGTAGPPVVPNAASRGRCGAQEEGKERDWPLSLAGNVWTWKRVAPLPVERHRAAVAVTQRPFLCLAVPLTLTALPSSQRGLCWGGKGGRERWLFSSWGKGKLQPEPFPFHPLKISRTFPISRP